MRVPKLVQTHFFPALQPLADMAMLLTEKCLLCAMVRTTYEVRCPRY